MLGGRPRRFSGRAALQHDQIVGMGKVQNGAGALVKHVRVEALRAEQGDVSLEPLPHLFQPGELAGKHGFPLLEVGASLQTMISSLEMVGEIAADAAGQQRKEE